MNSSQLLSKVITFLRFPLIIAVVSIHIQRNNGVFNELINGVLTRVAVPLFFLFSGFLFFYKTDCFTLNTYFSKLKKRIYTLFIPYLFWNLLYLIYAMLLDIRAGETLAQMIQNYSLKNIVIMLWNNSDSYPINFALWFIRDLMVVSLFTPFIYYIIKKGKILLPLIICGLFLANISYKAPGFSITAITFFISGAYFSISKINFVEKVKPYWILLGIFYLFSIFLIFILDEYSTYLKRVNILFGCAFGIAISAECLEKGLWTVNNFLAKGSFFVYTSHLLIIPFVLAIIDRLIPVCFSMSVFAQLLAVVVTVTICYFIYYFMDKYLPKFTSLITGGR